MYETHDTEPAQHRYKYIAFDGKLGTVPKGLRSIRYGALGDRATHYLRVLQ